MRLLYHEFESLEHLLGTRLLPGGEQQPVRFVIFGGTGAVGGAAVTELCRLILMSKKLSPRPLRGEIHATGLGSKEISKFVSRLYLAFQDDVEIEKVVPLKHYRVDGRIDLHFSLLKLNIPKGLSAQVAERLGDRPVSDLEGVLSEYFAEQPCPFLGYVEGLDGGTSAHAPVAHAPILHAVVVAIPLPSVATYALTSIDALVDAYSLDHQVGQRIKKSYLKTFIRGLAEIQQCHARHVVMAHTTAVGGMYRVDGGTAEIRLGFAHSSLGKQLVDKKYFADELTQLFVDHGFDVLVTAAAIGIDAVEFRCQLPASRAVVARLRERLGQLELPAEAPMDPLELDHGCILLYENEVIAFDQAQSSDKVAVTEDAAAEDTAAEDAAVEDSTTDLVNMAVNSDEGKPSADESAGENPQSSRSHQGFDRRGFHFGAGKPLMVDAAIRSGENGLFSVANCVALYNVMKVAIPEELAMVLVRHALFGPERRRDWFKEKICYYSETENSYFALRLLDSYPQLVRAHHGPFAVQAYQALGSATHQARLHELGLLMLWLRMRELSKDFQNIPEAELTAALPNIGDFLWNRTRIPSFQDLEGIDPSTMAAAFTELCEADSMEAVGRLLGFDPRRYAQRLPGREKFLHRLCNHIRRYLQIITSLGVPIIYRQSSGEDRLLVGPYVAPLDSAIAERGDVTAAWQRGAETCGASFDAYRDWTIVNNGFVDLRPHALGCAAKEPDADLEDHVSRLASSEELQAWLSMLAPGSYFTTCGTVALHHRLQHLGDLVQKRKVELGTRETWKHLFRQDRHGRHLISPGLVETMRMYCEGQGKITGTEALWPRWGY